jgi:hypothetical protein
MVGDPIGFFLGLLSLYFILPLLISQELVGWGEFMNPNIEFHISLGFVPHPNLQTE